MQSIKERSRPVTATTQPDPVPDLAGAWRGRLVDAFGNAESFNLQRDSTDHRLPGQFQLFSTPDGLVAGARLLEASQRTCVVLIGPYLDPGAGIPVVTVLEGAHCEGSMEGTFHTRRHGDRETVRMGHFTATRIGSVTRAA
ncbi:MAG TPA: hypothetical protein VF981_05455 [Gemmatimonadaceae bacterium]|jgi:hypothetical protein